MKISISLLNNVYINILIPIILIIVVNTIIFSYKLNISKNQINNPYIPPGYIIGIIWIIIFGLLGYVHYILRNQNNIFESLFIIFLLIFCVLYPFFTNGLQNMKVGLVLNSITLILSFIISFVVFNVSKKAFYYMIPLLLWTSYINLADRFY
jgi:tryptophan-rich sensory protein